MEVRPFVLPPQRILVVSLRRIGDALLTTPLIRSLRKAWPSAEIDVLVFSGSAAIFKGNPDIHRILSIPSRPSLRQTVKVAIDTFRRYDLAISTQTGDRPTFFALCAGRISAGLVEPQSGFAGRVKAWFLDRKIEAFSNIHRVEQLLRLADVLGIERVPEVVCPAASVSESIRPARPYAVIHAAPMFRYKEWTRDGWRELAMGLQARNLEVVAIAGFDKRELQYVEDIWRDMLPVHQTAWPETVSLLRDASAYIGPDTSVSHLAAAAGCPTVTIFGPMDPRVWAPWPVGGLREPWEASGNVQNRGNVWIVQNPLPCVPCTFEGCERRIDSYSACLDQLTSARVLEAVDQALGAANRSADLRHP